MTSMDMQVIWVDPMTKQTGGVLDLSPKEVENKTIHSFKQLVSKKLNLDESTKVDVKLYGSTLKSGTLEPYLPTLQAAIPRFVVEYTPNVRTLGLFVKTLSGKNLYLKVNPNGSIWKLKRQVQEVEGIPAKDQRLLYGSTQLENYLTVASYKISRDSTLYLLGRLRGGSIVRNISQPGFHSKIAEPRQFVDISDDSLMEKRRFSTSAPNWRRAGHGLNIEGFCKNIDCEAYEQQVIYEVGFHAFNLHTHIAYCPICDESFEPISCGMYKCRWRFEGMKDGTLMHMSSDWQVANDKFYHTPKTCDKNLVYWKSLVIIANRLMHLEECAVCFEHLEPSKELKTLACSHKIHSACFLEWKSACLARQSCITCPMCRANLV